MFASMERGRKQSIARLPAVEDDGISFDGTDELVEDRAHGYPASKSLQQLRHDSGVRRSRGKS
jgi:hypothetical protein